VGKPFIFIEFRGSREFHERVKGLEQRDYFDMIQGIEDGLYQTQNYQKELEAGQGDWRPLNPDYKAEKIEEGYSDKIWVRTGDTEDALTTRAIINSSHSIAGRRRTVDITRMGGGVVEAVWRILGPAAGGNFAKTNLIRQWVHRIRPEAHERAQSNVADVCRRYLQWILIGRR
jgi:hypothetical protein